MRFLVSGFSMLIALALVGCTAKPSAPADSAASERGSIEVQVQGLRSTKGRVRVLLFDSADGFPSSPDSAMRARSLEAGDESISARFESVNYGKYAVSVLHDENENGALDKNLLGIPQEGYGVSRNPKPGFGPPGYDEAVFTFDSPEKVLEIKVLYLGEMAEEKR